MKLLKGTLFYFIAMTALIITAQAQAENSKEYADHMIFYNAFPSDSLPAQMTSQYNLKRSKNYAIVNITVLEKGDGKLPIGVKSDINGKLKNLMGQTTDIEFREIKEGNAVYYIAEVGIQSTGTVNFIIDIKPEGGNETYELKFTKNF